MSASYNLPPGVSPNDPHITGEWPIEVVVDSCVEDIKRAYNIIEDQACVLDDQGYYFDDLDAIFGKALACIDDLENEVQGLIPEEPGL